MEIKNTAIYGLSEGFLRSGYPMLETTYNNHEFKKEIGLLNADIKNKNYENRHIKRGIKLRYRDWETAKLTNEPGKSLRL